MHTHMLYPTPILYQGVASPQGAPGVCWTCTLLLQLLLFAPPTRQAKGTLHTTAADPESSAAPSTPRLIAPAHTAHTRLAAGPIAAAAAYLLNLYVSFSAMSLSPTSKVGYMDREGMKRGSAINLPAQQQQPANFQ